MTKESKQMGEAV